MTLVHFDEAMTFNAILIFFRNIPL